MTTYSKVSIDLREVHDWTSFHFTFNQKMGFPDFYGHNMDAWIDCMSSVDAPDEMMSKVHAPKNGILILVLLSVRDFKKRCPEIFDELIDCLAFVNFRRIEVGDAPVLSISYHD
jgi:RNAse (barnase) inhibitor barstar